VTGARPPRLDADGARPVLEMLLGAHVLVHRVEARVLAIADGAPPSPDTLLQPASPWVELALGVVALARALDGHIEAFAAEAEPIVGRPAGSMSEAGPPPSDLLR